jgi:hypothetical protein
LPPRVREVRDLRNVLLLSSTPGTPTYYARRCQGLAHTSSKRVSSECHAVNWAREDMHLCGRAWVLNDVRRIKSFGTRATIYW